MIGNDIVDLKLAAIDSNWERPRFLNKVFTKSEQHIISNAEDIHQMVWLLWSMKEAAYKVNVQQFGERFFNPKKLVCKFFSKTEGIVTIGNENYFTSSTLTKKYVYTVATLDGSKAFISECFEVEYSGYHSQSEVLKSKFLKQVSKSKKTPINALQIKKNEVGVPKLIVNGFQLNDGLSLTHHGKFSAHVIL